KQPLLHRMTPFSHSKSRPKVTAHSDGRVGRSARFWGLQGPCLGAKSAAADDGGRAFVGRRLVDGGVAPSRGSYPFRRRTPGQAGRLRAPRPRWPGGRAPGPGMEDGESEVVTENTRNLGARPLKFLTDA